jgi:hypothetical protein
MYEQPTSEIAMLEVGKNESENLSAQCAHGSTLARLKKLRKQPIGFSK